MLRTLIAIFALAAALVAPANRASAGGWATIAFVEPLEEVITSHEITAEYRVLAHNNPDTPATGILTTFLFTHAETGYFVAVDGEATSDPEVYRITFTIAWAGDWDLRAMIHNYLLDGPILWTAPESVAATADIAA